LFFSLAFDNSVLTGIKSPSHDITLARNSTLGIKLSIDRMVKVQAFLGKNLDGVASFSKLPKETAKIDSLRITLIDIYLDEQGTAIAFDMGSTIFCNLHCFLHL